MRFTRAIASMLLCTLAFAAESAPSSLPALAAPVLPPPYARSARFLFEITDPALLNPVTTGVWQLDGKTLEVRFSGRIQPHEPTRVALIGPGPATKRAGSRTASAAK